ncbi:MAG TPA: ferritin-like domain-containing protein [Kofleriaceae bacterium]|nr:ferritin-like domain-containing protein [Kofleriaceae bacterium]
MPDLAAQIDHSHKLVFDDLDWALARRHGLTPRERECLSYFADIESQTVFYMLEVAKLDVARAPTFLTFLTIWNYEEFFHAHAITRLLHAVGVDVPPAGDRSADIRKGARLRASVEDAVQVALSKTMPQTFLALWQAWGAAAELLTCHAYEELGRTTANPVLAELCRRIAKQERRHFAWYHEAARELLDGDRFAQRMVRFIFERAWTPVGSGVKSPAERAAQIARLFPGQRLYQVFGAVDRRMAALPGLAGFDVCSRFADDMQAMLPADARVVRRGGAEHARRVDELAASA